MWHELFEARVAELDLSVEDDFGSFVRVYKRRTELGKAFERGRHGQILKRTLWLTVFAEVTMDNNKIFTGGSSSGGGGIRKDEHMASTDHSFLWESLQCHFASVSNCNPGTPKVFMGVGAEIMDSTVASFLRDVPIPISRKVHCPKSLPATSPNFPLTPL